MFLEPLRGYRLAKGEVPSDYTPLPLGKANVVREGNDCTVIAWSAAVDVVRQAADEAAEEGISAEIIDVRTLVPLDTETLAASVRKTGRVVVAQESCKTGGFAAEVLASIQEDESVFYALEAPMMRVCAPDMPYPVQELEPDYLLNKDHVLRALRKVTKT